MKNKILSLLILAIFAMSISSFAYSITGPITTGTDTHWSTTSGFIVGLTEDATYVYAKFSIKGPAFISGAYLGLTVDNTKVIPWDLTTNSAVAANGATAGTVINKNAWIPSNWQANGTYRATTAPYDYLAAFVCPPPIENKAIADGVTQELFTSVFKKQVGYSNIQSSGLAYFAGTLAARGTKVVFYTTAARSIGNVETVASTTAYNAPLATYYQWNLPATGYSIDYVENGGSTVTDATLQTKLPATLPNPTRDGYTFGGWFTDNNTFLVPAVADATISANTTLYAKWTLNTYSVTYVENGGSTVTDLTGVTALPGTLPTTTKAGYTFAGWYTDAGLTTAAVAGATISANTTLYAKWTLDTYSVTYVENGGSTVTDLTDVTALPDPLPTTTKDRYNFVGWYTDAGLTTAAVAGATISANTTLYAKWTASTVVPKPEAGTVNKGQTNIPVKIRNGNVIENGTVTGTVVSIPAKILASVTNQAQLEAADFGIIFGGVKFKFKVEAGSNAFANINNDGGRYFIKLVDPNGAKLSGKTFKAKNYFGLTQSTEDIDVTIAAN